MTSSNENIFRVTGHLCGKLPVTGEFPTQRPVTRSFAVFFDLRLNKRLSKQCWGWWLRHHCAYYGITAMPKHDRFGTHMYASLCLHVCWCFNIDYAVSHRIKIITSWAFCWKKNILSNLPLDIVPRGHVNGSACALETNVKRRCLNQL